MRAAVVRGFGQPLVIEDRPVPEPGPGQIVVRMEASGLCHTDIHAANGDWPVTPTVPFIPGHEGVGIVTKLGDGVTSPQIGQRVAVPWLGYACGTCRYCLTGWETLCLSQRNTGYSVDGGYAEYFLAEAAFAAPVPDGIDPREAAPLTCAGVTTYKALKVGNVRPGDLVVVSGVGGDLAGAPGPRKCRVDIASTRSSRRRPGDIVNEPASTPARCCGLRRRRPTLRARRHPPRPCLPAGCRTGAVLPMLSIPGLHRACARKSAPILYPVRPHTVTVAADIDSPEARASAAHGSQAARPVPGSWAVRSWMADTRAASLAIQAHRPEGIY